MASVGYIKIWFQKEIDFKLEVMEQNYDDINQLLETDFLMFFILMLL